MQNPIWMLTFLDGFPSQSVYEDKYHEDLCMIEIFTCVVSKMKNQNLIHFDTIQYSVKLIEL